VGEAAVKVAGDKLSVDKRATVKVALTRRPWTRGLRKRPR
jgi:hypothetical protein